MIEMVSTIMVIVFLPLPFFLFLIHTFIGTWRKLGRISYPLAILVYVFGGVFVFFLRQNILSLTVSVPFVMRVMGILILLVGVLLSLVAQHHLGLKRLVCVPEVLPQTENQKLIMTGIYAYLRHPRYAGYLAMLLGWFLYSQSVIFLLIALLFLPVIRLEEKELKQRFGKSYGDYTKSVPALIPKIRR